jgi:hypothetical protein
MSFAADHSPVVLVVLVVALFAMAANFSKMKAVASTFVGACGGELPSVRARDKKGQLKEKRRKEK